MPADETRAGRVGTLTRIVREKRWEALRATLERNVFPKWLFYERRLVFCCLRDVRRPKRTLDFIRVREAMPEDEPLLHAVRDRSEGYAGNFARGDVCYLAMAGDEPAAFLWIETGRLHVSEPNRYTFDMGETGCWSYGVEVHPSYRLKGAFGKLWSDAFDLIRARGLTEIYTSMPEDENVISLRSHGQLGFEIFCRFRVSRTLGVTRHTVTWEDGRRASGFGVWRGAL